MSSCGLVRVCLILPRVRWFGERQPDAEQRAALTILDRDVTAMNFDGPFRNRETQTGAAVVSRPSLVEPEEAIKDPLAVFGRHTRPLIGDFQDRLFAFHSYTKIDSRFRRAVLDRVVEDVRDCFAKHEAIGGDDRAVITLRSQPLITTLLPQGQIN